MVREWNRLLHFEKVRQPEKKVHQLSTIGKDNEHRFFSQKKNHKYTPISHVMHSQSNASSIDLKYLDSNIPGYRHLPHTL